MKKLYLFLVLSIPLGCLLGQGLVIDTVYFQFNRAGISDADKYRLDSLIGIFTAYPAYYVELLGNTDSIGSTAYNLDLSLERAKNVALYLSSQGIDLGRVTYVGMGTTKPVSTNDSYAGRSKNRRVDIAVIYSNEIYAPVYEEDSTGTEEVVIGSTAPVVQYITDTIYCDYNSFSIDPKHRTVIISPRGTKLIVPPDAFLTDEATVNIEFSELFDRKDMIYNNMPTVTKDGPLEVPGSFSFEASAGRRALKIAKGASFRVELPATRRDADMEVFVGSGGTRSGRRKRRGVTPPQRLPMGEEGDPGFNPVKTWNPVAEGQVRYLGREKAYRFEVDKPGRYAVGRPLYHSQNTDPDAGGMNIRVKLKGRRFEQTTQVMLVGEVVKTYIPLKQEKTRIYEATRVKYLDPKTKMILIAIQYDDKGNPYLIKRSFVPRDYIKNEKNRKKKKKKKRRAKTSDLPSAKLKAGFRKMTPERLEKLLIEINGTNEKVTILNEQ